MILDVWLEAEGERLSNEPNAEGNGYSEGSGTFINALSKLRTLDAAEGYAKDGGARAADVFFERPGRRRTATRE